MTHQTSAVWQAARRGGQRTTGIARVLPDAVGTISRRGQMKTILLLARPDCE